jgi:hypothetical protein
MVKFPRTVSKPPTNAPITPQAALLMAAIKAHGCRFCHFLP